MFDEKTARKLRLYKAISKKWFLRSLGLWRKKRDTGFVKKEYGRVWSSDNFIKEEKPYAQELEGQLVFWSSLQRRKFVISYFSTELTRYGNVGSVLEMGSGNGANILLLALLHPEIKEWYGVELTSAGVRASQSLLASPPFAYIEKVTGLRRDQVEKRLSHTRIVFTEGSMTKLPFQDRSIDVVFSCQAIEQLPRAYMRAFSEARRVAKKHTFFLEEFREAQRNFFEAQRNFFERMHLKNADYFCASFRELERVGFNDIKYKEFPLRPLHYGHGFVSCNVQHPMSDISI